MTLLAEDGTEILAENGLTILAEDGTSVTPPNPPISAFNDALVCDANGKFQSLTQPLIDDSVVVSDHTWSSNQIFNIVSQRNRWKGEWVQDTYQAYDQVRDQGWLMIANKTTTDRAGPIAVGSETYVYAGASPDAATTAKQIVFGNRYTAPTDVAYQIDRYRVYTTIGNVYRVFSVGDPTGAALISELISFTAIVDGWTEFAIEPTIVADGASFDLVAVVTEPDPTPTTFTGNWNYTTPNNTGVPGAGVIIHANRASSEFRINKTDNDTTDRSTDLATLTVGDVIDFGNGGTRWSIQSITDNTTWYNFGVSPATQESPDGVNNFTFETVTATPITRMEDVGWWTANSPGADGGTVEGLYIEDDSYENIVPNGNAYGTDVQVQRLEISDDWDIQVVGDAGVTGGSSVDGRVGIESAFAYAKVENGFIDRSQSTISFDDGTRTFTIAPTDYVFLYVQDETPYAVIQTKTVTIPDTEGLYFFYFEGEDLKQTDTFVEELITDFALVAVVYWDADNDEAIFLGEERHGNTMDSTTHSYNHLTLGARFQRGLALGNMDVDGNGNDASAAQFSVADGVIWDEDIQNVITDGSPQELSTIAEIPMYYRTGASGLWRKVAATQYPITTTGSGRPAWNEFTGGAWQLTEIGNNDYVLTHYYATNDIVNPVIGIVGQGDYATLNDARDAAPEEINTLAYGPLGSLTPEFVPIATVIWETKSSYGNAVKARVRSTDDGKDYLDWRFVRGGVAASV